MHDSVGDQAINRSLFTFSFGLHLCGTRVYRVIENRIDLCTRLHAIICNTFLTKRLFTDGVGITDMVVSGLQREWWCMGRKRWPVDWQPTHDTRRRQFSEMGKTAHCNQNGPVCEQNDTFDVFALLVFLTDTYL